MPTRPSRVRAPSKRPGLEPGPDRWDSDVEPLLRASTGRLWRAHSDAVNVGLVERWLPERARGLALKTDLFDEAMGDGLFPRLDERNFEVVAIDIAASVLAAAASRHRRLRVVAADVRRLPFADGSFDLVVSNSTLDHFANRGEILAALVGLHRVLKPGGLLLITMDNLRHPAVALRNALPQRALRRLGLVDYPVGATVGPRGLARLMREARFEVLDTAALLHCPRVVAVRRARSVERHGSESDRRRLLRRLSRWEALGRLSTRYVTAHYVGMLARKA